MKLVWKCDYCNQTDVDKDKIEEHEVDCIFDPSNRHCYTCDNHDNEFGSEYCKIKCPKFWDVLDHDLKCNDWVNEEIRNKKLKKIKDKISENS